MMQYKVKYLKMKIFQNRTKRWVRAQNDEKTVFLAHNEARVPIRFSEMDDESRQYHLAILTGMTRCGVETLKKKVLLEVGGVGYAGIAAEFIPEITAIAIDPLVYMYQMNFSEKCRYICGNAEQINLKDQSIDFCICRNAIDHMLSPDDALREIKRVLKNDGKLYISCNVFNEWSHPFFPIFNLVDTPHPHHYTEKMFLHLLRNNGYKIDHKYQTDKINYSNFKIQIAKIFGLKHQSFFCSIK